MQAGADVVVGSHRISSKVPVYLGSALVDYGLGNFVFYTGTTSGVLTVTMTGRHVDRYGWEPSSIIGGVPNPVTGPAQQSRDRRLRGLRACTDLTP